MAAYATEPDWIPQDLSDRDLPHLAAFLAD